MIDQTGGIRSGNDLRNIKFYGRAGKPPWNYVPNAFKTALHPLLAEVMQSVLNEKLPGGGYRFSGDIELTVDAALYSPLNRLIGASESFGVKLRTAGPKSIDSLNALLSPYGLSFSLQGESKSKRTISLIKEPAPGIPAFMPKTISALERFCLDPTPDNAEELNKTQPDLLMKAYLYEADNPCADGEVLGQGFVYIVERKPPPRQYLDFAQKALAKINNPWTINENALKSYSFSAQMQIAEVWLIMDDFNRAKTTMSDIKLGDYRPTPELWKDFINVVSEIDLLLVLGGKYLASFRSKIPEEQKALFDDRALHLAMSSCLANRPTLDQARKLIKDHGKDSCGGISSAHLSWLYFCAGDLETAKRQISRTIDNQENDAIIARAVQACILEREGELPDAAAAASRFLAELETSPYKNKLRMSIKAALAEVKRIVEQSNVAETNLPRPEPKPETELEQPVPPAGSEPVVPTVEAATTFVETEEVSLQEKNKANLSLIKAMIEGAGLDLAENNLLTLQQTLDLIEIIERMRDQTEDPNYFQVVPASTDSLSEIVRLIRIWGPTRGLEYLRQNGLDMAQPELVDFAAGSPSPLLSVVEFEFSQDKKIAGAIKRNGELFIPGVENKDDLLDQLQRTALECLARAVVPEVGELYRVFSLPPDVRPSIVDVLPPTEGASIGRQRIKILPALVILDKNPSPSGVSAALLNLIRQITQRQIDLSGRTGMPNLLLFTKKGPIYYPFPEDPAEKEKLFKALPPSKIYVQERRGYSYRLPLGMKTGTDKRRYLLPYSIDRRLLQAARSNPVALDLAVRPYLYSVLVYQDIEGDLFPVVHPKVSLIPQTPLPAATNDQPQYRQGMANTYPIKIYNNIPDELVDQLLNSPEARQAVDAWDNGKLPETKFIRSRRRKIPAGAQVVERYFLIMPTNRGYDQGRFVQLSKYDLSSLPAL